MKPQVLFCPAKISSIPEAGELRRSASASQPLFVAKPYYIQRRASPRGTTLDSPYPYFRRPRSLPLHLKSKPSIGRKSVQTIPRKPVGGIVRRRTADIRVPGQFVVCKPRMNAEHERSMEKHMEMIEMEYVKRLPSTKNKRRSLSADSISTEGREKRRAVERPHSRRGDKERRPGVAVGRANTTVPRTTLPRAEGKAVMSGGLEANGTQNGAKVRPLSFRRLSLGDISPGLGDLFAWQREYNR